MLKTQEATGQRAGSAWIAEECHGANFFEIDDSLQSLLKLYMNEKLRNHLWPHLHRLGRVAGGRLDDLSRQMDENAPTLQNRNKFGQDDEWIDYHPAYREMEKIGFGEFGIHCMARRPGVLGWPEKIPELGKLVFHYMFAQSEYGFVCPMSMTDSAAMIIERFADEETKAKFLPRMHSQDLNQLFKGGQFMTEKAGGSDMENFELEARQENDVWRLYGEKWFCSVPDADVAVVLARPEGAVKGTKGLAFFVLPKTLENGKRNSYRIVRLKNKLGTKSLATGEVIFNGAIAYPMGKVGPGENQGLRQALVQLNIARLHLSFRATGLLKRSWNEALVVAKTRFAFGERIIDKPLLRRQLMKILVPTEQALSIGMYAASQLDLSAKGNAEAEKLVRILTPLAKFRASRDSLKVATYSLEVRGGNGYVEDWVNARLVRDVHTGVIVEGTSNVSALDIINRAVAKSGAHRTLSAAMHAEIDRAKDIPGQYQGILHKALDRAVAFADEIARTQHEPLARKASNALYHAATAIMLASEGAQLGQIGLDARRLVLSRMVVAHRLTPQDPMGMETSDDEMIEALLSEQPVDLKRAQELVMA